MLHLQKLLHRSTTASSELCNLLLAETTLQQISWLRNHPSTCHMSVMVSPRYAVGAHTYCRVPQTAMSMCIYCRACAEARQPDPRCFATQQLHGKSELASARMHTAAIVTSFRGSWPCLCTVLSQTMTHSYNHMGHMTAQRMVGKCYWLHIRMWLPLQVHRGMMLKTMLRMTDEDDYEAEAVDE